ncbi:MAG: GAF domain-containing protein [Chloroflexi bacterium]|nr:MAG: GAF domain-containing protein [Chloroflexota bacterium]TMF38252.1 MAG: GAF domain-containing protein [Chloroflexota bacterium]
MAPDLRRPSATELLAEAAAQGADLETVARGVLARLSELTGLSSTYLAETRLTADEQYIVFSCNRSDVFHIPEDVTLPWSEGVCRFVVEGGPHYTTDAQKQFPSSSVARLLEIRTFVSYPVFTAEGRFFGTLCGASKEQVEIEQKVLDLMRECARLIGQRLRADVSARP